MLYYSTKKAYRWIRSEGKQVSMILLNPFPGSRRTFDVWLSLVRKKKNPDYLSIIGVWFGLGWFILLLDLSHPNHICFVGDCIHSYDSWVHHCIHHHFLDRTYVLLVGLCFCVFNSHVSTIIGKSATCILSLDNFDMGLSNL